MSMTFPRYSNFCKGRFESFPVYRYQATREVLFDLVAPVTIYLKTDVRFEKQARDAVKQLAKMSMVDETLEANLFTTAGMDGFDLKAISQGKGNWDRLCEKLTWGFPEVYNSLLADLAEDSLLGEGGEGYTFELDDYGAYGYTNGSENFPFNGDEAGMFAFYTNAEAVKERVADAIPGSEPR